jgi:hypothetical protein
MKSIWDTDAQREVHDRLTTLSADRRARWGKMSAQQMVCHLSESLKMGARRGAWKGRTLGGPSGVWPSIFTRLGRPRVPAHGSSPEAVWNLNQPQRAQRTQSKDFLSEISELRG